MSRCPYVHGHCKSVQPLLLQLSGFKKDLESCATLLVSHVEPITPLRRLEKEHSERTGMSHKYKCNLADNQ